MGVTLALNNIFSVNDNPYFYRSPLVFRAVLSNILPAPFRRSSEF
jgi:hypothetical protein